MAKSSTGSQSQSKPAPKGSANPKGSAKGSAKGKAAPTPEPAARPRMPLLDLSAAPAPLQRAARFMFAGSIGSFVLGAYTVAVTVAERSSINTSSLGGTKKITAGQALTGFILWDVVLALVSAALWAWMARMNQGGRSWARYVATALFLLWTLITYQTISGLNTWFVLGVLLIEVAIWGVGAAALYYLWRPDSTAYFKEQQRK